MHSVLTLNGSASVAGVRATRPGPVVPAIRPLHRSTFQRILLVTDGTVTEMLEAYSGEAMRLVKLHEEVIRLDDPIALLEVDRGDSVLRRQILLQGKASFTTYLYADSFLALDRLDAPTRETLLSSHKPIGYVIQEQRMETFREILQCRREVAGALGASFHIGDDAALLSRTYRVFANRKPIMLITEKFPESHFED